MTSAVRGTCVILPDSAVSAEIDVLDDGHSLLPIVICEVCAKQFNISTNARLRGDAIGEPGLIPYVAPTCFLCFAAWREGRSRSDA